MSPGPQTSQVGTRDMWTPGAGFLPWKSLKWEQNPGPQKISPDLRVKPWVFSVGSPDQQTQQRCYTHASGLPRPTRMETLRWSPASPPGDPDTHCRWRLCRITGPQWLIVTFHLQAEGPNPRAHMTVSGDRSFQRAAEMAQQLRARSALPEEPSLLPRTHIRRLTASSRTLAPPSGLSGQMHSHAHTHTHTETPMLT